jgi:hypothetical protein
MQLLQPTFVACCLSPLLASSADLPPASPAPAPNTIHSYVPLAGPLPHTHTSPTWHSSSMAFASLLHLPPLAQAAQLGCRSWQAVSSCTTRTCRPVSDCTAARSASQLLQVALQSWYLTDTLPQCLGGGEGGGAWRVEEDVHVCCLVCWCV